MGPRPIGRGNRDGAVRVWDEVGLQWGRDQLVAEIHGGGRTMCSSWMLQWGRDQLVAEIYTGEASYMDWARLQWGRDQLVAEIWLTDTYSTPAEAASMGPRPIGRGNNNVRDCWSIMPALQWGRDQLVAEIKRSSARSSASARLQWGRDQLVAEIALTGC